MIFIISLSYKIGANQQSYLIQNISQLLQEMADRWAPKKPNFGSPPPGYIAGLGRGATGFITRSDVGTARAPDQKNIQTAQTEEANYTQAKFSAWQGYSGALFPKGAVDQQDKQAEEAYDFCEKKMWQRRQKERITQQQKIKSQPQSDNSITAKFIDLKRELAKVTTDQWESIPECVDLSIKKRKRDRFTAAPDALVMNILTSKQGVKTVEEGDDENLQDFREAKEVLLKSKLDNLQNGVSGKTNIDRVGYITQLNSQKLDGQFLGDVKKARLLLRSALASNPKNSDIWLSAARVEELDGKLKQSRQILRKAIQNCPLCQDLWIQLSRLQRPEAAKDVLIEGLRFLPANQKLWLYAARRQQGNKQMKSKILRKGLENVPSSVRLWRQLIQLENVEQARNLLYKAVQALPKEIDLWLALAKTQDYKGAQKVLNKARKSNPLSLTIWISAARLQQAQSKVQPIADLPNKIQTILSKSRQILRKNGANITRDQWLQQALHAEKSQSLVVCEMLVKISVGYGLAQQQLTNVILKDTRMFETEKDSNYTTRFLYKYGILLSKSKQAMREMIEFENRKKFKKQYDELNSTLRFAIQIFQTDSQFWRTIVSKLLKDASYDSALVLLSTAQTKVPKDQQQDIRLLRVKVYLLKDMFSQAKEELAKLREQYPKGAAVFQSIRLEYQMNNFEQAWHLCEKYFRQSKSQDIWRLAFKVKQKMGNYNEAYSIIQKAVSFFPESLTLWKDIIEFQLQNKHVSKARALIDRAIQKMPRCEELYILAIELERKLGYKKQASSALSKAMKIFSKNPQIWAISIELQPENTRKKKASSAIEVCGQNQFINCSIAKLFWKEGKPDKAKRWFEQSLKMNPNQADIWAYYIRLLQVYFPQEKQAKIQQFSAIEGELQGRKWNKVRNDKGGWKLSNQRILQQIVKQIDAEINSLH